MNTKHPNFPHPTISATMIRKVVVVVRIHGTKKVLDSISFDIETVPEVEENPLFTWHANVVMIDRRKALVLMNEISRYVIVLYGVKAKDFKRLDQLVVEAIRESFAAERIPGDVVDRYIEEAGNITFHKSKNRSSTTRVSQACDYLQTSAGEIEYEKMINIRVGERINRLLVGFGKNEYDKPFNRLRSEILKWDQSAILHIEMMLTGHSIWRKVIVPLDYTLTDLHQTIQKAFGWEDSHLYEFYVAQNQDEQPIVNLVMHEESMSREPIIPVEMIDNQTLATYLPAYEYIEYIYDLGDDWKHAITVESIADDYSFIHPTCIGGEGTTPPENCGGEGGFAYYLECVNNPSHPEHEFMKQWGGLRMEADYNQQMINQ